jgi:hypothetical protein
MLIIKGKAILTQNKAALKLVVKIDYSIYVMNVIGILMGDCIENVDCFW